MTDSRPQLSRKKTPSDATEFEREQLGFFLAGDDLASKLATINPSMAWLPLLLEMRLVQHGNQLVNWIEHNFNDPNAIRDVVENLRFFHSETANFLEHRLNAKAKVISPLLLKCWRLVVRSIKESKQGLLQNDWYEIEPQIEGGEPSAALLGRIAEALRPKLKLSKRISWNNELRDPPENPSDLMSINYEVDDYLVAEDILKAWPEEITAENDSRLLSQICFALKAMLEDAIEVGVEGNEGYGISDSDVPSVAPHDQNNHRTGFFTIVRVAADLWTRLAKKSPLSAIVFVEEWSGSSLRLIRRMALFAASDSVVSAELAKEILISIPIGEIFLTSSSVESYRLIRNRWNDFSPESRREILVRICQGPPKTWFKKDADTDRSIDRCRYDFLGEMKREGFEIGDDANEILKEIMIRWPNWQLRPAEQAGFHVWLSNNSDSIFGDSNKFLNVGDDNLVDEAIRDAAVSDFLVGDNWQALCLIDPDRAIRGLGKSSLNGNWPQELWRQFLWTNKDYVDPATQNHIAKLLLQCNAQNFSSVSDAASWWLDQHANSLDDHLLWPLWDRIVESSLIENVEVDHA